MIIKNDSISSLGDNFLWGVVWEGADGRNGTKIEGGGGEGREYSEKSGNNFLEYSGKSGGECGV